MRPTTFFLGMALLASSPALAAPQSNSADEVDVGASSHDQGNSKLGLLGLLGLAGLLGLRRREPDIHVDARRDRAQR
jgi:MYXO-CTERM domain-containing protein